MRLLRVLSGVCVFYVYTCLFFQHLFCRFFFFPLFSSLLFSFYNFYLCACKNAIENWQRKWQNKATGKANAKRLIECPNEKKEWVSEWVSEWMSELLMLRKSKKNWKRNLTLSYNFTDMCKSKSPPAAQKSIAIWIKVNVFHNPFTIHAKYMTNTIHVTDLSIIIYYCVLWIVVIAQFWINTLFNSFNCKHDKWVSICIRSCYPKSISKVQFRLLRNSYGKFIVVEIVCNTHICQRVWVSVCE